MASRPAKKPVIVYRSAVTGRFVKVGYAKKNPRITEKEQIRRT